MRRAAWLLWAWALPVQAGQGDSASKFDVFGEDSTPKRGVAVILIPESDARRGQALRLSREATRRLAAARDARPIELAPALDEGLADERASDIEEGVATTRRGLLAFEELELESAGAELDMAINLLLPHADTLDEEARRELDIAMFSLATTSLFEGQDDVAEQVFVALALFSPGFSPRSDKYPSNVVARFAEIRDSVHTRARGNVQIISKPPGAAVWIDGEFRGSTPLDVAGLADGQHAVVLERLGYRRFGTLAPVGAGRASRMEVDLEPTKAAPVADGLVEADARSVERAVALGKKLGASHIAVLALSRSSSGFRARGSWVEVEAARALGELAEVALPDDPKLAADAILGAISLAEEPPVVEAPPVEAGPSEPLLEWSALPERWWFWAVVGGVLVATASGVAAAASGPDAPPSSGFILGF